jgi:hypothetical protein
MIRLAHRLAAAASRRLVALAPDAQGTLPRGNAARPRRLNRALVLILVIASFVSAQAPVTEPAPRFTSVDIFLDPHGSPLAAYQLEFLADPARVTLVGIEGGAHSAFKDPPYYDAKALSGNRVILAALNTAADVPKDKTRVARLHLRIVGTDRPTMTSKLIVAASSSEQKIQADVTVSEGANP